MLGRCHCVISETISPSRTDLPPLTLAVVGLEQTLVVRDTVLAEHEPMGEEVQVSNSHGPGGVSAVRSGVNAIDRSRTPSRAAK